jgi:hypothetical protein
MTNPLFDGDWQWAHRQAKAELKARNAAYDHELTLLHRMPRTTRLERVEWLRLRWQHHLTARQLLFDDAVLIEEERLARGLRSDPDDISASAEAILVGENRMIERVAAYWEIGPEEFK